MPCRHNHRNWNFGITMIDKDIFFGFSGCLASVALVEISEGLSVCAGLLTVIYMTYKIYLLHKNK